MVIIVSHLVVLLVFLLLLLRLHRFKCDQDEIR